MYLLHFVKSEMKQCFTQFFFKCSLNTTHVNEIRRKDATVNLILYKTEVLGRTYNPIWSGWRVLFHHVNLQINTQGNISTFLKKIPCIQTQDDITYETCACTYFPITSIPPTESCFDVLYYRHHCQTFSNKNVSYKINTHVPDPCIPHFMCPAKMLH
jgi:hypothetical protein